MSGAEPSCDLSGDIERIVQGQRTTSHSIAQRVPLHELGGDEVDALRVADLVDG